MFFIAIIIAVIFFLIVIAKSSSSTKQSAKETETILRSQVADANKRLDPEWLLIKSQLESDAHVPSEIEMLYTRWRNGEWASFTDTIDGHEFFEDGTPDVRRKARNIYFKAGDRHDAWEDFFFKNGKNMTSDEIKEKHKEYLRLNEDEYAFFNNHDLGVNVSEYLSHKF